MVHTEPIKPLRWSEFPITFSTEDHWVHIPDSGSYPLVVCPTIDGALLPKTLIDGGSGLNIIFTSTLKKMKFDFSKMTAYDEPFYGIVPGKAALPLGRVSLPVTFGTIKNYHTEYVIFEVVDFASSYHAILGRPMLARFMAIPHYTYLVLKMPTPNEVLSVYGDLMISYNCNTEAVDIGSASVLTTNAQIMIAEASQIDRSTVEVPEQKRTSAAVDPSWATKKICLGLPDASKEVTIGAELDPK